MIEYHGMTVYFGGDTAYAHDLFAETRARFGAIDLALLPISPLEPRAAMRDVHMNPGDAIAAFLPDGLEVAPLAIGEQRVFVSRGESARRAAEPR